MTLLRKYEETHPWIKFKADLTKADYRLWIALGEAISKCEHLAGVPLQPAVAKVLHTLYLAKGAGGTAAIEGNTLTEEEVIKRLEGKLELPPSREYLGREIDNVAGGCKEIFDDLIRTGSDELTPEGIGHYNKAVLDGVPVDDGVVPGKVRSHGVGVLNYRGAPPEDCAYLLGRMCEWLNGRDFRPEKDRMLYGIIRAVLAHLYIAWIHPFGDGNGRTARLVEFKVLLSCGIPTPAAHLLSNHYNLTRTEYYRQLEHASRSGGDILPFVHYAVSGFVDGLREQIKVVQEQQLELAWRDYAHDRFRDKKGVINERRRHLALGLSRQKIPVPLGKIREISPRVAVAYAGKHDRTIMRDIDVLLEMGLITKETTGDGAGYRALFEKMLSFVPVRIENAAYGPGRAKESAKT